MRERLCVCEFSRAPPRDIGHLLRTVKQARYLGAFENLPRDIGHLLCTVKQARYLGAFDNRPRNIGNLLCTASIRYRRRGRAQMRKEQCSAPSFVRARTRARVRALRARSARGGWVWCGGGADASVSGLRHRPREIDPFSRWGGRTASGMAPNGAGGSANYSTTQEQRGCSGYLCCSVAPKWRGAQTTTLYGVEIHFKK